MPLSGQPAVCSLCVLCHLHTVDPFASSQNLSSNVIVTHDDLPDHVTVMYTSNCPNGNVPSIRGTCDNVAIGQEVGTKRCCQVSCGSWDPQWPASQVAVSSAVALCSDGCAVCAGRLQCDCHSPQVSERAELPDRASGLQGEDQGQPDD